MSDAASNRTARSRTEQNRAPQDNSTAQDRAAQKNQTAPSGAQQEPHSGARRDSALTQILGLAVMIAVPVLIGFGASRLIADDTDGWYDNAQTPPWNPPDWLFSPVWSALYVVMGVAAWLIWRERHRLRVWPALGVYAIQLLLNAAWSPLFFSGYPIWGSAALWAAFAVILALIIVIVLTIRVFWPINRLAAVLLIPYLAWVLYASTLNFYIALTN
ncbi:tryptophan-rich sensory protein [Nesterenkonia massiliensis]|uniref:Tryptophan-rich sensory protein n=1 Tax=Nesterenkonia massiliensis TaxID=1232429 RepID=A0ABT2HMJ5_9MICC|nr:TspO/MBR family protein [Nesterenkonia massiliensis]MCT1605906.1 tryptophan-rich sensory protein [Nesterenkonia massiliensis]